MVRQRIRQYGKSAVPRLLALGRRSQHTGGAQPWEAVIFCYHSINQDNPRSSVPAESLKLHIEFLQGLGYQFLTVGELVARMAGPASSLGKTAVLTFDDGFEDAYTRALPILLDHHIRATFFVTSGLVVRDPATMDRCARLMGANGPWLGLGQLRQMRQLGMEIGGHTHTHPNLARLNPAQARRELACSRMVLEDIVLSPINVMAYPFGRSGIHYTRETRDLARQCGYVAAASTASRTIGPREDPMQLPRFFVNTSDSCETIAQKARGDLNWLGRYHELSPAWLKRIVCPEEDYE